MALLTSFKGVERRRKGVKKGVKKGAHMYHSGLCLVWWRWRGKHIHCYWKRI